MRFGYMKVNCCKNYSRDCILEKSGNLSKTFRNEAVQRVLLRRVFICIRILNCVYNLLESVRKLYVTIKVRNRSVFIISPIFSNKSKRMLFTVVLFSNYLDAGSLLQIFILVMICKNIFLKGIDLRVMFWPKSIVKNNLPYFYRFLL